jgi:drug/metabolite transporter (DMT)-like permease
LKLKNLLLILFCALCWGPSYLFIKLSVNEVPPLTLAFSRVAIAAIVLYPLCRMQKHKLLKYRHLWKEFAIMGITLNALPFYLVSRSELYLSSSLTGILNSMTLIFTAILGHFFGRHDPFTRNKILGIFIAVAGLAIIYLPTLVHQNLNSQLGASMVIAACLSYGTGTVYARTHLTLVPGLVALTSQLILASLVLFPFVWIFDAPFSLPLPSQQALLGLASLGVIGTAAGFYFYFKAIQAAGATYASFAALLLPVIAMICGAVFLNEQLSWNLYLGTFFILAGIWVVQPLKIKSPP